MDRVALDETHRGLTPHAPRVEREHRLAHDAHDPVAIDHLDPRVDQPHDDARWMSDQMAHDRGRARVVEEPQFLDPIAHRHVHDVGRRRSLGQDDHPIHERGDRVARIDRDELDEDVVARHGDADRRARVRGESGFERSQRAGCLRELVAARRGDTATRS